MAKSYDELLEKTCISLSIDPNSQDFKNRKSALVAWTTSFGLSLASEIGDEFGNHFDTRLADFSQSQAKAGVAISTIRSRQSLLRSFHKNYKRSLEQQDLPTMFRDRFMVLLSEKELTPCQLYERYFKGKCSSTLFRNWTSGFLPSADSLSIVKEVEEVLLVPPGTLTSTIPQARKHTADSRTTVFRQRVKKFSRPYLQSSPQVKQEVNELTDFKTKTILPPGMKRNGDWTVNSDGSCYSSLIATHRLESFFGFCSLPKDADDPCWRGLGLSKELLGLELLADAEKVEGFVEFMYHRSDGVYHYGTINFVALASALLREETGYLWQSAKFAKKVGLSMKAWQAKCNAARKRINEIWKYIKAKRKARGRKGEYSRDPNIAVEAITSLPDPLSRMFSGLESMRRDLMLYEPGSDARAAFVRDVCLFGLLLVNPLRINMFVKMKLNKNLVRDADGAWWIIFEREDFKNRAALKSDDYKARVSPTVWPLIDDYITNCRPTLLGENESDYVFVNRDGKKSDRCSLSKKIFDLSKVYFPETPGFRAHAIRHIVATGIIKKDRKGGFYTASRALHDKQATVEKNYAHLKITEEYELVNNVFDEFLPSQRKEAA